MRKLPMLIKPRFFGDRISKLLFAGSVIFFAMLIAAQICLKNAATRAMFTDIEKYEKISYAANSALKEGYITVELTSGKPSEKIEVWFNGEPVGAMHNKSEKIIIECDGVIELKNDSGSRITAEAGKTSGNIELLMSNKPEIVSGIKVLCSVNIK